MNRRMICFILGRILVAEALLMLLPILTGLIYREAAVTSFVIPMAILLLCGILMGAKRPQRTTLYAKDGFFIVAAAWVLMSLAGALPFISAAASRSRLPVSCFIRARILRSFWVFSCSCSV